MYFKHIALKSTSQLHGHIQNRSFFWPLLLAQIFMANILLLDSIFDHFLRASHVIEHFSYIITKRIDKKLIQVFYSSYEINEISSINVY